MLACPAIPNTSLPRFGNRCMSNKEYLVKQLQQRMVAGKKMSWSKGFNVGRDWATNAAQAVELYRLDLAREGQANWSSRLGVCANEYSCTPAETLVMIFRSYVGMWQDEFFPEDFWEEVLQADRKSISDYYWLVGFADGANSVWITVADEIRSFDQHLFDAEDSLNADGIYGPLTA